MAGRGREFIEKPFSSGTLETCIDQIEQAAGKGRRKAAIEHALSYIFSTPLIAIESKKFLSTKGGKASGDLKKWFNPSNIVEYVSTNGKKAGKNDYITAFESIADDPRNTPIAIAMVTGYLQQPSIKLQKAQKDIRKQKEAARQANEVGRNFADALFDYDNSQVKGIVLGFVTSSWNTVDINSILDILMVNSIRADSKRLAMEAEEIIRFLELETNINTGLALLENFSTLLLSLKKPNMLKVWGEFERHKPHLIDSEKELKNQLGQQVNNIARSPIILTSNVPLVTKFGFRVTLDAMEKILGLIPTNTDPPTNYRVIRTPHGRLIAVISQGNLSKKIPKELRAKIRQIVLDHSRLVNEEDIYMTMTAEEINSVLEFTQPVDSDLRKIAKAIPKLVGEVQGGLNAISKRGIKNIFDLDDESIFREMGLKEITFKQEEGKVRVITVWNGGEFHFFLNYDYKHDGLKSLSEESRNWLLVIVYSYLKAIKNRESKIVFINEEQPTVEGVLAEAGEETEEKRKISRIPHLRVLAFGETSNEKNLDAVEKETIFHFGVGINKLNQLFTLVQKDPNALSNPRSTLNREINNLPYQESVKRVLIKLINRVKLKKNQPEWKQFRLKDKLEWRLVPKDLPEDYNPESHFYEVTFVKETELEGTKPREINCPGVVRQITEEIKSASWPGWHSVFNHLMPHNS